MTHPRFSSPRWILRFIRIPVFLSPPSIPPLGQADTSLPDIEPERGEKDPVKKAEAGELTCFSLFHGKHSPPGHRSLVRTVHSLPGGNTGVGVNSIILE